MSTISIHVFKGMLPIVDDRLLPDENAALAENFYMKSGALIGLPKLRQLYSCVGSGIKTVYRLPNSYLDSTYLYNSTFMEFEDINTDVLRSPVFNDTYDRYYWASSSDIPQYNTRARIDNGDPAWDLGIEQGGTLSINVTGGSGPTVTRVYVYTFVSEYGEEGPPSEPITGNGNEDGTWEITVDQPDSSWNQNLTDIRIYRTLAASPTSQEYYLVTEIGISGTDSTQQHNDTAGDTDIAGNNLLESFFWFKPPDDLQGIILMSNGIVAGWRENEIWFSEPYRPHAWPSTYVLTTEYPIVGMGVVNQNLVICTRGYPEIAFGQVPAAISMSKLLQIEPCISRKSILSNTRGVFYASPNGLIRVVPGLVENITKDVISRNKWQTLMNLFDFKAGEFDESYYAYGASTDIGAFQENAFQVSSPQAFSTGDEGGIFTGILIDGRNQEISLLTDEEGVDGIVNDIWTGELFLLKDDVVYFHDQSVSEKSPISCKWKSKIYQSTEAKNLGCIQLFFEVPDNYDGTENDYGTVKTYADGVLVSTHNITKSGKVMRLPSGFLAHFWQFEIDTTIRILSLHAATNVSELVNV